MAEFNVSVNIIRDEAAEINYIPTRNAVENFNLIGSHYQQNNKFLAIIGSYGTGKSSFLWALEQNLKAEKNYFGSRSEVFPGISDFFFIKLIGEYRSLASSLREHLGLRRTKTEKTFFTRLDEIVLKNSRKNILTVLVIDEFGKFLEYAIQNNPDKEVYFIQQLAEYFNDPEKKILAITSLHQNFSSYGYSLNTEQFKEWEKVKGRVKEIAFNEPIEQLLYFASERNPFKIPLIGNHKRLYDIIRKNYISDKKGAIDEELAEKLLPLDYISAEIMAKALQRYGQNERSLFSFLDLDEKYSFQWFFKNYKEEAVRNNKVYSLNLVYDYLVEHYHFFLNSTFNTDLTTWNAIRAALDQVDTRLNRKYVIGGRQIIKTIGLLNIFVNAGAKIDRPFIVKYASLAMGFDEAGKIVDQLIKQKIISYKKYKHRFVFVDWTDLNIDNELRKASQKVPEVKNVAERVAELNEFHPVLVKAAYFKTGTPRFFGYHFSKEYVQEVNFNLDGIINYVFPEQFSSPPKVDQPILYAVFKKVDKIRSLFFEIDKAKRVIEENKNDRAAIKELDERIFYHVQELKALLVDEIFSNPEVEWYKPGRKVNVRNRQEFHEKLNQLIELHYAESPVFKNELVNKTRISTPVSLARRSLIAHMLDHREEEDLGFENDKFPPEKMIYLSLLQRTGIHRYNSETGLYELGAPDFEQDDDLIKSYHRLWQESMNFLELSKHGKKNVKDLMDLLKEPPLKLKKGFVDFWVPLFLIIKKDDYALFNENGYIPNVDASVFDVLNKSPHKFWVKAFDISGVKLDVFNKYKAILHQKSTALPSEKEFINTIKPFILFIRSLPEYSLRTRNLSKEAIRLREAIINAKDPEKAFFEDFPKALGYLEAIESENYEMLEGFVEKLETSIRELRSAYDELLNRFEAKILETIGKNADADFEQYKTYISAQLGSIDASLLNNTRLKNIYRKCTEPVTDRKAFLEGLTFAVVGKNLQKLRDEEEPVLYKNFEDNYKHLLELVDVHEYKAAHGNDAIVGVRILTESGDEIKQRVIIPARLIPELQKGVLQVNKNLNGMDKDMKKAILIELLKEEIDHGER